MFNEPEVVVRIAKHHHVGLVWHSKSYERVLELERTYIDRVKRDYHASKPAPAKATD